LVDDVGKACICDFALSVLASLFSRSSGSIYYGPIRWMAPELFDISEPTLDSDVYSFAMICIEVAFVMSLVPICV
jgi:Protein tyrosine and serine/threonine kinase